MTSYNEINTLVLRIKELERRMLTAEGAPRLSHSAIQDGGISEYDIYGNPVARYGKQWDGTHTSASLWGPTPPRPTAPTVEGVVQGLNVTWDGLLVLSSEVIPMDFSRVEIHVSTLSAAFVPDETTLAGTIESPRGGSQFFSLVTIALYYVKLCVRSQSGKLSEPSDAAGATPLAVPEPVIEIPARASISSVTGTWVYDSAYIPKTSFTVDFAEVTTSTEGIPLNVIGYELWSKKTSETDDSLRLTASSVNSSFTVVGLDFDISYTFKVRAVGDVASGELSPGVTGIVLVSSVVETAPAVSAPVASSKLSVLNVFHDFKTSTATTLPAQVQKIELQKSTNSGPFVLLGFAFNAGSIPDSQVVPGDAVTVRARSVLFSGKTGAWSTTSSTTIVSVVDADLVDTTIEQNFTDLAVAIGDVYTTVDGKNTTTYSTEVATGSGAAVGDTWNRINGSEEIIAQWRWSGSAWVSQTLENAMFANIDAGKITSGFIDAARIAAGSITAENLLIASGDNLLTDPLFSSALAWSGSPLVQATGGRLSGGSLLIPMSATQTSVFTATSTASLSYATRVEEGKSYRLGVWYKCETAAAAAGRITIYVRFYDPVTATFGSASSVVQNPTGVVANTWTWMETSVTVPAGMSHMAVGLAKEASHTTGAVRFDGAVLNRRAGGELIVDGTITTVKLDALSITSDKLAANSVIAGKILAGSIDGMIITGAILRTAASGQRVHIDTTGLKGYNNLDQVITSISASDGKLTAVGGTFSGALTATSGSIAGTLSLSGSLIAINPSYPDNTLTLGSSGFTVTTPLKTVSAVGNGGVFTENLRVGLGEHLTASSTDNSNMIYFTNVGMNHISRAKAASGNPANELRVETSTAIGDTFNPAFKASLTSYTSDTFTTVTNTAAVVIGTRGITWTRTGTGGIGVADPEISSTKYLTLKSQGLQIKSGVYATSLVRDGSNLGDLVVQGDLSVEGISQFLGAITAPGGVGGLPEPTADSAAATKFYVDSNAVGTNFTSLRASSNTTPTGTSTTHAFQTGVAGSGILIGADRIIRINSAVLTKINFPSGITGLPVPTAAQDAVTKEYVDDFEPASSVFAYSSGWGDYSGVYSGVEVFRTDNVIVSMMGMFKRTGTAVGSTTALQNVGQVQPGFKPIKQVLFMGIGFNGTAYATVRVDISTAGVLTAGWVAAAPWNSTTWVTLYGLTYRGGGL